MSLGWSIFIIVLTVANIAGAAWLTMASSRMSAGEGGTTGHVWDGDVVEGNNPLPRWWLGLFWLTIAFSVVYLVLYESFGEFSLLGTDQFDEYEAQIARAEAVYGEIFAGFAATPIAELAGNPDALDAGRNLFANNCATCHGSDARGARGYPNLTDDEWLWGGEPEQIRATIANGRTGVMPPFGAALDTETINRLADYVVSLAGRDVPAVLAEEGRTAYMTYCVACHGANGEGNRLLGAPAFDNERWTHGSGMTVIRDVIANGRTGVMPAQAPLLGDDRVHVLAAYVLSLSDGE